MVAIAEDRRDDLPHPWVRRFLARPSRSFTDLISGATPVAPYWRAEADDVITLITGEIDREDPFWGVLDGTVLDWLKARRAMGVVERQDYGRNRFVKEVVTALRLVRRLDLAGTIADLNTAFPVWRAWAEPLRLSSSHDPLVEILSLLASHQTAPDQTKAYPPRLWLWHQILDRAGTGLLPDYYVDVALAGLRNGPSETKPPPALIAGLARWARHLTGDGKKNEQRDLFLRRWRLESTVMFPRQPKVWLQTVAPVLEQESFARTPAAGWWRDDLGLNPGANKSHDPSPLRPPRPDEIRWLLKRLRAEPFTAVRAEALRLLEAQRHYTERTGDSGDFVQTVNNVGKVALKTDAALALDLAKEMLCWEPNNPYGWMLWAGALTALGQPALAEMVFWEAARRFPQDDVLRTALANLLARLPGREAEAEALFRETLNRFPHDDVSRTALATLLARLPGREAEAEALFRETLNRFPHDDVSRTALANLLARLPGREAEAEALFRETLARSPTNPYAQAGLAFLMRRAAKIGALVPVTDENGATGFDDERLHPLLANTSMDDDDPGLDLDALVWPSIPIHPTSPPAFGRPALDETVPEDRGRLARTKGGRDARGPEFLSSRPRSPSAPRPSVALSSGSASADAACYADADQFTDDGLCVRANFRLGETVERLERPDARDELRREGWADLDRVQSHTPDHPLAAFVSELQGRPTPVTLGDAFAGAYGLKLSTAFRNRDAGRLAALAREVYPRQPLVVFARLTAGAPDDRDAHRLATFLASATAPNDPPLATLYDELRRRWQWDNAAPLDGPAVLQRAAEYPVALKGLVETLCCQTVKESAPVLYR